MVVPAYKQEKTIRKDLLTIEKVLKEGLKGIRFEIICVVDGVVDKTLKEAQKTKSRKIKILHYEDNKGKGFAVRWGMQHAKGDLISFLDAGRDISPQGIMMLLAHLQWYNADIIVGSKRHPVSRVNYPFIRRLLSIGYHFGVKLLFGLPITDTQSGIKIFKKKVIKRILPKLHVNNYAMDIEFLVVARRLGFKRIYEAPIEVKFSKKASRVRWHTSLQMAWDSLLILYKLRILKYYD